MKKVFLATAALLAATWSMSSAATSYSLVCNGCTQQQTRLMVQGSAQGDYFVHDMLNRQITHWSVTGTDPDTAHMALVAITPAVQTEFNWVLQLWDSVGTLDPIWTTVASGAVTQATVNVLHTSTRVNTALVGEGSPAGSPMSAYDTINTPSNQEAAIAAATGYSTWGSAAQNLKAALASFTSHFVGTQIIYPVPVIITQIIELGDGSTISVHWDPNNNIWVYNPGSARDSSGNPIPENASQASGGAAQRANYVWQATAGGINDAMRASQNFSNIGLGVGAPVFRAGGSWSVACIRVGGPDGTVSCTATPN